MLEVIFLYLKFNFFLLIIMNNKITKSNFLLKELNCLKMVSESECFCKLIKPVKSKLLTITYLIKKKIFIKIPFNFDSNKIFNYLYLYDTICLS